jgi:glycosyltransferase involved in cell wall biosynthesis
MNVCFVTLRMAVGGAERVIAALCRGLRDRGHRVSVVSEGGVFADELAEEGGVTCHSLSGFAERTPSAMLRSTLQLRDILSRLVPDVINVHAFSILPAVVSACRLAGLRPRICFSLHAPTRDLYYYAMGPTIARLADDVSTVCADLRRRLYDHGMPHTLGEVLYNGIDRRWLRPMDEIEARPLPGARRPVRLGILARINPKKGHATLIDAMARLRDEGDAGFALETAGDGPYRAELEALVRARGLVDQVRFHGNRSDADAFLDSIDLFVLPSFYEGFPMSILEAMARGTPVLSSAVNGVPEMVTEGRTGFLFPAGNVPALARALKRIVEEPERVRAARRSARELVERRFLTEHMVAGYEQWFSRV